MMMIYCLQHKKVSINLLKLPILLFLTVHLAKVMQMVQKEFSVLQKTIMVYMTELCSILLPNLSWNQAFIEDGFQDPFVIKFRVSGIPTAVLVDPEGNIVTFGGLRGDRLFETLEAEFNPEKVSDIKESAPAHK